ncbi:MAG TPA: hypothetical protein PKB02_04990 [Anaerohalosphaeraceae bacterium]|nr:hypothetical protein [Anaerohalosphaeraceae bacterium]
MAENGSSKPQSVPSKSFMTAGPALHYSHTNVHLCWGLSIAVYLTACFFWSRLLIGEDLSVSLLGLFRPEFWNIGRFVDLPLSIYEYPWQIVVLGILMGILATVPVLTSQLLSFRYSIPMILSVMLVSRLGLFGVFLLASCIAVACRPLRFRSRFISVALCMAPQVAYWAIWGGYQSIDPIRWGFSYAPWLYAWLTGLFMSAIILIIGHYNRYKPGGVWLTSFLLLALASWLFYDKIGFSELDYQLYVAGSSPEEVDEFHDHSLTETLNEIMQDESTRSWLQGHFYPAESLQLREKLKADIQNQLVYGNWPQWIQKKLPEPFLYQSKRQTLLRQYERFIDKWPKSDRMPIVLYYKALLLEMYPNIRQFGQTEILRFYSDYPYYENILIWQKLYDAFPSSPEALEARWRIAMHESGRGKFEKAEELCDVAVSLIASEIQKNESQPASSPSGLFSAFNQPAKTIMTASKLRDLAFRMKRLRLLIGRENQGTTSQSKQRLAEFVMLNPYRLDYDGKLVSLLAATDASDPLRDNILLAQALIVPDSTLKFQKFTEITETFPSADAAVQALYEMGVIKISLWKNTQNQPDAKKAALSEARALLTRLTTNHPKTLWAEQANKLLNTLPASE